VPTAAQPAMIVEARKSRFMSCPPSFIMDDLTKASDAPPAGEASSDQIHLRDRCWEKCAGVRDERQRSLGCAQNHAAAMRCGMRIGAHP
jgi:hypothetical protein